MPEELIPEDHYLRGREGHDEGRLARARAGLPEEIEETPEEEAWEGLAGLEEAIDVEKEEEPQDERQGVVVVTWREALAWWARWHREAGSGPARWLPKGLDRPSTPYGSPVGFQVAELVESTPLFLLFERRLRAAAGLSLARDALPADLPPMPIAFRLLALPVFLAGIEARLPREFFPPEVVGSVDLLPEERKAQAAIEAKYRRRYPGSWRGRT